MPAITMPTNKFTATAGRYGLSTYELYVNGALKRSGALDSTARNPSIPDYEPEEDEEVTSITIRVKDLAGYTASDSR